MDSIIGCMGEQYDSAELYDILHLSLIHIFFWQIWRVTVPGDMTRTVMRSIGKRRNNEKRRGDADEDTDRRNHI